MLLFCLHTGPACCLPEVSRDNPQAGRQAKSTWKDMVQVCQLQCLTPPVQATLLLLYICTCMSCLGFLGSCGQIECCSTIGWQPLHTVCMVHVWHTMRHRAQAASPEGCRQLTAAGTVAHTAVCTYSGLHALSALLQNVCFACVILSPLVMAPLRAFCALLGLVASGMSAAYTAVADWSAVTAFGKGFKATSIVAGVWQVSCHNSG